MKQYVCLLCNREFTLSDQDADGSLIQIDCVGYTPSVMYRYAGMECRATKQWWEHMPKKEYNARIIDGKLKLPEHELVEK